MKTISRAQKPSSSATVEISWSKGVVRLRDKDLFGQCLGKSCVIFLRRVFALSEVKSVEIDCQEIAAEIRFDERRLKLGDHLQRLATALRGQAPPSSRAPSDTSLLGDLSHCTGRIKILRLDTLLTTWDIVDHQPGRIRLRHESIRADSALAIRVRKSIEDMAGVISCSVQPITGSVLIRFNPTVISPSRLLQILERERRRQALPDLKRYGPTSAGFGLSNMSLALATAGEIAVPALLPVCAILLVGSNLTTFRRDRPATCSRAIGTLRTLYKHYCSKSGQWSVCRFGRNELDVHVLESPVLQRITEFAAKIARRDHTSAELCPTGRLQGK